jgi:preprotein translocase SecE subunit
MANAKKKNVVAQGVDFYRESVEELKKVHPPTKQETVQGTIGVLIMVFMFGLFLGLADLLVGKLMQWVLA